VDTVFSNLENKKDKDKALSSEDKKDLQLQSAINVIKGMKIYSKFQQK
jgi:hypothetical protein